MDGWRVALGLLGLLAALIGYSNYALAKDPR